MDQLLRHMVRDVANIVCEYMGAPIWMRPFKPHHCMMCGIPHQRLKTNVCRTHACFCVLCLHSFNAGKDIVCPPCRDQLTPAFIDFLFGFNRSKTILEELYATREELDQDDVERCAFFMLNEYQPWPGGISHGPGPGKAERALSQFIAMLDTIRAVSKTQRERDAETTRAVPRGPTKKLTWLQQLKKESWNNRSHAREHMVRWALSRRGPLEEPRAPM